MKALAAMKHLIVICLRIGWAKKSKLLYYAL